MAEISHHISAHLNRSTGVRLTGIDAHANPVTMATTFDMQYNYLGKTGVKVSNICLGTLTFGKQEAGPFNFFNSPTQSDEKMAHTLLNRFVELGGNFVDTANMYGEGLSESIIGHWFQSKEDIRNDIVLATKVRYATKDKGPNNIGLSRRHITQALEGSLQRLQTSYVDLYQAHGWDNATPIEETLRTFDDLVRCGKIHYYGYSNLCGWQMQQVVDTYKSLGLQPCVTLQQQYSLLHRHSEWEPFMVCQNEGIAVLPWGALTGGMLTGKFKRGTVPDAGSSRVGYLLSQKASGRLAKWEQYSDDDRYWTIIDLLKYPCIMMNSLDKASPNDITYPYDIIWDERNTSRYNQFNDKSVNIPKTSI